MNKLIGYFRLARAELAKVIFPTKEQVQTAFMAVVSVVFVVLIFIALVDSLMSFSISKFVA
ncbi:MAG: preprotein translocase subunit SecE [Campylobacter sp.]|uniref:preprotein translocase subunit SecE n=1 Tax=Campylobacter sp. TaxID=205 RepID=UPI002972D8FC|nr:preprotein translocase subunit SecE [Campylobacter sp.]MDD7600641.1 preprotein translocase subunit SecE [Campylobacteraceae bacterium]MDY5887795.1 preprotein translocase subunit SecE [Campylobacter sp.]